MLGAIAGDVIGSVFEGSGLKSTTFPLFSPASTYTDDTILTVAVASAILGQRDYAACLREFGRRRPDRGYGGHFKQWLENDSIGPYHSWGNGAAMRVSPIGWAFGSINSVLHQAQLSAAVTHNHPEGIRGAQAIALAVFLARHGAGKDEIRRELHNRFGYDLQRSADEIRPEYAFDISCQGSVPEAIVCFLDSENLEEAIRLAISLGGDADTMACIAGAIAEAHYGRVSDSICCELRTRIPLDLFEVVERFQEQYVS